MIRCSNVGLFCDGELGWFSAWLFRRHLRRCAPCQAEVRWAMTLMTILERVK